MSGQSPVERAEAAVIDAMVEHGPDGHIDGYEEITQAALKAALDVDELAAMLARLRFQEDMPYVIARAVVAHLTKGDENDE